MNYLQKNKLVLTETTQRLDEFRDNSVVCRSNGFTLIELMVTMAIAAIVLALGVPSFQAIVEKNRISSEESRLFSALKQARNNAIITGSPSYLCRLNAANFNLNNIRCNVNINGDNTSWSGDFLVFTALEGMDIPNGAGNFGNLRIQQLENDNNLKNQMVQSIFRVPDNNVTILASNNDRVLQYNTDGTIENTIQNGEDLRFTICDSSQEQNGRIIVVNQVGVIRSFATDPDDAQKSCDP